MVSNTPRFSLKTFSQGETGWDHTDTVELLDKLGVSRGVVANRPSQGEYDSELYLATDEQIMYVWDDSASSWNVSVSTRNDHNGEDIIPERVTIGDVLTLEPRSSAPSPPSSGGTFWQADDGTLNYIFANGNSVTIANDGSQ